MSTSGFGFRAEELPRPPEMRALNISQSGEPTEYYFEKRFGAFHDAPYYEEAKRAYLHKKLNSRNECGVNTWHEQLLAGRITPEDMKVLGYTNLVYFKNFTTSFLVQMTDPKHPLEASAVRAAMDSARNSYTIGGNKNDIVNPKTAIHYTLFIAIHFGGEEVLSLRNHHGVTKSAELLVKLQKSDPEMAVRALHYIDDYYEELRLLSVSREEPDAYKNRDFLKLMEAGVTAQHAAERTIQGLSVERAIEASDLPATISNGVL